MPGPIPLRMQQVHLGRGALGHLAINPTHDTPKAVYAGEHAAQESILLKRCPGDIWPGGTSYTYGCPRPILMYKHHHKQLILFHESITVAIVDIVRRWFTDRNARFPERMPLLEEEEKLLQVRYYGLIRYNLSMVKILTYCSGWIRKSQRVTSHITRQQLSGPGDQTSLLRTTRATKTFV